MNSNVKAVIAAVAAAMVATAAQAECTIFEKPNFEGGSGTIAAGDLVTFFTGEPVKYNGVPESARTFNDTSWRNNVGSVKVAPSCTLLTFDQPEAGTQHRRFLKDSPQMIANMNTEVFTNVAAAYCSCK